MSNTITEKSESRALLISLSMLSLAALSPAPVKAQTLSCPQGLNFGNATACASSGTIVVHPDNTRTLTGCLTSGGAPFSRGRSFAKFSFSAHSNQPNGCKSDFVNRRGGDHDN